MIKTQGEKRYATEAERRAAKIVEEVDEAVGHTMDIPQVEIMQACYNELSKLMARWVQKMDNIQMTKELPDWVRNFVAEREKEGRFVPDINTATLGFEVENLFFGRGYPDLTTDLMLVSEPSAMWKEDFESMVAFCNRFGLDFFVNGYSRHLPGTCFRVVIYRVKPGSKALSKKDLGHKILVGLQVFDKLQKEADEKGEVDSIERDAFKRALIETGEFDDRSADKILENLLQTGQIPKRKIV